MNQVWKDAWWLTKFEWNKMKFSFLISVLVIVLFSIFFGMVFPSYEGGLLSKVLFDILFLIGMTLIPYLGRTKEYALNKLYGNFWGSPYFNFLSQTPISEKALIRSRFLIYSLQSFVLNIILFSLMYTFSHNIREAFLVGDFILFSLFWITIGLQMSALLAATEVGSEMSIGKMIIYSIILYAGLLGVGIGYYWIFSKGIIEGTIFLIENYPIITLLVAILLLVVDYIFWLRYSNKVIHRSNYL